MKLKSLLLILSLFFVSFSALGAVAPQLSSEKVRELKSRSSGLISEAANRRLLRAHELAAGEQYKDAIELLSSYLAKESLRDNEKAQFLQNLGFVQAQKGDYDAAIKNLQAALDTRQLPYSPTLTTQFALGQLYLAKEKYKEAIATVEEWFQVAESPKAEAYVVLGTAYAQTGNKQKALELVEVAISKSPNPSENWLLFALGLNFEMQKWPKCAELLEYLTSQFPGKSQYWKQLSGVYLNMDKNAKALASLELAYKQGHLEKEGEIVNLAALYLDQGVPLKAGQVLEKEIKAGKVNPNRRNLELVADSFLAAREIDKSMDYLAQAAKVAEDGKVLAKQGQLLLDQEKWQLAAQALSGALNKGKLNSPEQIHLGLGIAMYNLQNYKGALTQFQRATQLNEDFRAARQWINYAETAQQSVATGL